MWAVSRLITWIDIICFHFFRVWHQQLSRQPLTETLRLEMGRYEATSLGSKFGFFRRGRIIAFLQCGNVTWSNDALHMAAMTGLMISLDCLISHVGAGSNRHCFAGDFRRIFAISSIATGWNSDSSSQSIRSPILGGDDADVDVRICSIFVTKYCEVRGQTIENVSAWLHQVPQLWPQCPGVATTGVDSRRADNRTRANHRYKFRAIGASLTGLHYLFAVRTVSDWNQLPAVVAQENPAAFKAQLAICAPVRMPWPTTTISVILHEEVC